MCWDSTAQTATTSLFADIANSRKFFPILSCPGLCLTAQRRPRKGRVSGRIIYVNDFPDQSLCRVRRGIRVEAR